MHQIATHESSRSLEIILNCDNLKVCIVFIDCVKKQEAAPKLVVIFPTKNEEDTIEHVIRTAK
jgi:hypothetical protein